MIGPMIRRRNLSRYMLIALAALGSPAHAQERLSRLPPERFDVIPPETRVRGAPGEMSVWQMACRIGPPANARRRIVDIAVQEWGYFGFSVVDAAKIERRLLPPGLIVDALNPATPAHIARGYPRLGVSESAEEAAAVIAGYWSATPDGGRILAQQNRAWTGPGRDAVNWLQPWSAAFVSWVMCEAGLGAPEQFRRDASHRLYVDQAIRARDGLEPDAAYVAYDAGEQMIVPGDLLCNGRGSANYRNLADRRPDMGMFAATHCDIVVKVDEVAMRFLVIGGNINQSVSLTILPAMRDAGRKMRPVDEDSVDGARTVFAHLKLRADPIEPRALENAPTIRTLTEPLLDARLIREE